MAREERRAEAHMEELSELIPLEVAGSLVRVMRPYFLECTHLLPCHVARAARHLEHVREVLDHHTSEHVDEDVLVK